jgi:phospholipid/cholesterol/gamma-HCH transport system ATP-binding protein
MSIIELRNVSKRFDRLVVLRRLSLSVEEGKSLVILGASGSGKSVMLKHMVGLLEPDSGEVLFDGQRIDGLPERQLVPIRRQFGFLFQMGALFDSLTVEDNIAFPLVEHTKKTPAEISEIVGKKLAMVGLPEVRKKMPAELSGGQRKRVALARAIALDPIRSDVINELILKLQRELNATSVVVTHDMNSAFKVADRIVMLHEGKLIFDGTPQEIQHSDNPIVHAFVMGEATQKDLDALHRH